MKPWLRHVQTSNDMLIYYVKNWGSSEDSCLSFGGHPPREILDHLPVLPRENPYRHGASNLHLSYFGQVPYPFEHPRWIIFIFALDLNQYGIKEGYFQCPVGVCTESSPLQIRCLPASEVDLPGARKYNSAPFFSEDTFSPEIEAYAAGWMLEKYKKDDQGVHSCRPPGARDARYSGWPYFAHKKNNEFNDIRKYDLVYAQRAGNTPWDDRVYSSIFLWNFSIIASKEKEGEFSIISDA